MLELNKIWEAKTDWDSVNEIPNSIPELSGGVNPGDQRAIYNIIKCFDVKNVLEIGTHIGSSTVCIALALKNRSGAKMTTVDIRDVNTVEGCPKDLIEKAGCESFVEFRVSDSIEFLRNTNETYDFIFLDGSHTYEQVYEELPIAFEKLSDNGLILFHDYFPNLEPLWPSSRSVITGPYQAVQSRLSEGLKLYVQPCGSLPSDWKTKYPGETNTSLALGAKYV